MIKRTLQAILLSIIFILLLPTLALIIIPAILIGLLEPPQEPPEPHKGPKQLTLPFKD